jgi:hypothetical protein
MKFPIYLSSLLLVISVFSQDKINVKSANISGRDFTVKESSVLDSNTSRVILADIGSTAFIGNKDHLAPFLDINRYKVIAGLIYFL